MYRDIRLKLIEEKLNSFLIVIPVLSPKGGVGKTSISSALALLLARYGIPTSFLDLDITNPTSHIFLGIDIASTRFLEDRGIVPPTIDRDLEYMSIALFVRNGALPLRGRSITNAIRELLSITRWRNRVLIIDMPPGFSDPLIELMRFKRKIHPLLITLADPMSLTSVEKLIKYLRSVKVDILGVVGNMCRNGEEETIRSFAQEHSVDYLGCVYFIENISRVYGDRDKILKAFREYLSITIDRVVKLYEDLKRQ